MNDLIRNSYLVLFNIFFIFGLYLYTKSVFSNVEFSKRKIISIYLLCIIFCIFSFWGADWFGYLGYYIWLKDGGDPANVPMEGIYLWLMMSIDNYLLFRLIVWGCSIILFAKTLKILQLNRSLTLYFFVSIYLIYFSYARATLAISLMFYGYSYLWIRRKSYRLIDLIWGISCIALSFFFHKSAFLGIISIIASTFMIILGRKAAVMTIIAFPLLIYAMNVFFQDYLSLVISDDSTISSYAKSGADYLDREQGKLGISTIISWTLERFPYYILAYISYKELMHPSYNHSKVIRAFFAVEFIIIVFASVFLFDFGVDTSTIYGRFMRFAQIPSVILLSHLYSNTIRLKLTRCAYIMGLAGTAYMLIYSFYDSLTI